MALSIVSTASIARADAGCRVSYAAGIGHLLKGETLDVSERNQPIQSGIVEDASIRVEIKNVGGKFAVEGVRKDTEAKLELQSAQLGAAVLFAAKVPVDLGGYREIVRNTPGAASGKSVFLFAICATQN